ncbi:MAG TPA: hypothetical protein DCE55_24365 [Planctomycetaceae bacterium]|nr:hypothetical protein [Planctomycetaceae bacterium]|tara:strand:- start:177 stop:461 length:285 start_codon:yes stop_codon:yes gene_type:complete
MKPLLASLLVLTGCSAQREELPAPLAETALKSMGDTNEMDGVRDFDAKLNRATPFIKTLGDEFGIGNATATRATADHQPPAEKQSATTERAITK